jgi:hypothetical protein
MYLIDVAASSSQLRRIARKHLTLGCANRHRFVLTGIWPKRCGALLPPAGAHHIGAGFHRAANRSRSDRSGAYRLWSWGRGVGERKRLMNITPNLALGDRWREGTVTVTRWLGTEGPYSVRLWIISHTAATASGHRHPAGRLALFPLRSESLSGNIKRDYKVFGA